MTASVYESKIYPIFYRIYEIFSDNKILILFALFWIIVAEFAKISLLNLILVFISFFAYFILLVLHTIQWAAVEIINLILYPVVLIINATTGSSNEVFFTSVDPFSLEYVSENILPIGNPKLAEVFILFMPLLLIFVIGFLIIIFTED
ncbi:MAG: hypothetical protein ACW981_08445 [Candidatus Hodarchaeales archaeon]|jgi:hypothetical protein